VWSFFISLFTLGQNAIEPPMTWKITLHTITDLAPAWEEVLSGLVPVTTCFATEPDAPTWRVEGYSDAPIPKGELTARLDIAAAAMNVAIPVWEVEHLEARDWVAENQKDFPPLRIGRRFFIHGSHHQGGVPAGRLGLCIDAATAFGTGEHPTTRGCIILLERLKRQGFRPRTALDLGCGSAILAMAINRLWPECRVLGTDNHAPSVRVARENMRRNRCSPRTTRAAVASGFHHPLFRDLGRFDLIVANILAAPLFALAPDIRRYSRGSVVLSGLLVRQERRLHLAYRGRSFTQTASHPLTPWQALLLR
jgi:ribosomal protein L11 methyltransferase